MTVSSEVRFEESNRVRLRLCRSVFVCGVGTDEPVPCTQILVQLGGYSLALELSGDRYRVRLERYQRVAGSGRRINPAVVNLHLQLRAATARAYSIEQRCKKLHEHFEGRAQT